MNEHPGTRLRSREAQLGSEGMDQSLSAFERTTILKGTRR
jgi:hypothetical protein